MTAQIGGPGPTTAQRAWMARLGSLRAIESPQELADKQELAAGSRSSFLPIDPVDIIPGLIDLVATDLFCHGEVINNTDRQLELDPQSIEHDSGHFTTPPSNIILPGKSGRFVAENGLANLEGVEGELKYLVDDKKTAWRLRWNNPRVGDNTAATRLVGPDQAAKARFKNPRVLFTQGESASFTYILELVGGGTGPQPTAGQKSSCLITVINDTEHVLTLVDQGHDRGDFMTFPPSSLQPGARATFASVETPDSTEQGCKGFLVWEVGSPVVGTWRVEWDNPEQSKNTTSTRIDPATAPLRSLDQIGQGEDNVPVAFTLSGLGQGPGPGPKPPGEDPEFAPPLEARQPTLRKGDQSVDGWVEYLQKLLSFHLGQEFPLDGNFDSAIQQAVITFQSQKKLLVDGVVGNQTWAALRQGAPEPPSTDGRRPHSHVEHDVEARWDREKEEALYLGGETDQLSLFATSVGTRPIDRAEVTMRITPPRSRPRVIKVVVGPPTRELPGGGHFHTVVVTRFKARFPADDPAARVSDYKVEAYFDAELGGDLWAHEILEL